MMEEVVGKLRKIAKQCKAEGAPEALIHSSKYGYLVYLTKEEAEKRGYIIPQKT